MLNRTSPSADQLGGDAAGSKREALQRRFPTIESLRRRARQRVPRFAFDFVDGGANDEECARRNLIGLSAVELFPRYCVDADNMSTDVELFGRNYSAPLGVAPMGSAGLMWPGAEIFLAREAQRRRVPYILATPANASIERIARSRPTCSGSSSTAFPKTTTRSRSISCGAPTPPVLMCWCPTIDSAGKSKRPRDISSGVKVPFRIGPKTFFQVATSPHWAMALSKTGMLRTENIVPYTEGRATRDSTARTMQVRAAAVTPGRSLRGCAIAGSGPSSSRACCIRADAERLVSLGVDGMIVSNHGGRHFDGAPASVDMLPAIVAATGTRATVMVDSGIRSGLDIVRALALGAKAAFVGRPFLYGLGALGEAGARHVMDMYFDELRTEFQHVGVRSVAAAARSRPAIRALGAPTSARCPREVCARDR